MQENDELLETMLSFTNYVEKNSEKIIGDRSKIQMDLSDPVILEAWIKLIVNSFLLGWAMDKYGMDYAMERWVQIAKWGKEQDERTISKGN
jgi:hypothetical protein